MTSVILVSIFMTLAAAATPILLAGLGELVTEKAGVLNLGVEGMMLCGAVTGFAVAYSSGSVTLGLVAAAFLVIGGVVASASQGLIIAITVVTMRRSSAILTGSRRTRRRSPKSRCRRSSAI